MSIGEYKQSVSGYFPSNHDVSDKWTAIKLWIENQEPSVVLLAPVHTAARKVIVLVVREGLVKALHRWPNVYVSFVEGLKARNFGNFTERP